MYIFIERHNPSDGIGGIFIRVPDVGFEDFKSKLYYLVNYSGFKEGFEKEDFGTFDYCTNKYIVGKEWIGKARFDFVDLDYFELAVESLQFYKENPINIRPLNEGDIELVSKDRITLFFDDGKKVIFYDTMAENLEDTAMPISPENRLLVQILLKWLKRFNYNSEVYKWQRLVTKTANENRANKGSGSSDMNADPVRRTYTEIMNTYIQYE